MASYIAWNMPLPAPQVQVAPPARSWFVNIAGWVWVEDGYRPYQTTHAIRGRTATVLATPVEMTFWPGNGDDPQHCDGPGAKWFKGQSETAPGRCTHTYVKNTPEQTTLPSGVTITYRLTWSADDGTSGVFGDRPGPLARVPINVDQIVSTAEPLRRP